MKCENCGMEIVKEFTFAITNNSCPGCGKKIMNNSHPEFYFKTLDFIDECYDDGIDNEKLAFKLANYVSEKIKDEIAKVPKANSSLVKLTKDAEESIVTEDGIRLEPMDKTKSKKMLDKMREEALQEAISDRYEIELSGDALIPDSSNPADEIRMIAAEQKLQAKRDLILSGGADSSKGGFRRA